MYHYHAYGLRIQSELSFPELLSPDYLLTDFADGLTIKIGRLKRAGLDAPISKGLFHQATERQIWLNIPPIAHFLISDGNIITVFPVKKIDEDSIRECILSVCLGVILLQRGLFVLQGSTIKMGNDCFSISGLSGAGKSTLTSAFLKRGYSILTDEFSPINSHRQVLPGYPRIKLWFDTLKQMNIETENLERVRPPIQKFGLPLGEQFHTSPLPVKVVYIMSDMNQTEYSYHPIVGVKKIPLLQNFIYKKNYLEGLEKYKPIFLCMTKLVNQLGIVRIERPHEAFNLDECVDFIENDLQERGLSHG